MTIRTDSANHSCTVTLDGIAAGTLVYRLLSGRGIIPPASVVAHGNEAVYVEFNHARITDRLAAEEGFLTIRRRWEIGHPGRWRLLFIFVPQGLVNPQLVVPSVLYHGNRHGRGKFPRGGVDAGWSFREDRIPIPSCAILHDEQRACAVFTDPAREEAEISSIRAGLDDGRPGFELRVPFTEEPRSYREIGILIGGQRKAKERWFTTGKRDLPFIYERSFYVYRGPVLGAALRVFGDLSRFALRRFGPVPREILPDWNGIASLKLHHLLELVVDDPARGVTGIRQGKGNGWWLQHAHENTAGSFLSKSLEGACVLARAGLELGSDRLLELAERIGRFFLQGALENGLHRDFYKFCERRMSSYHLPFDRSTTERREGANARCNGETMVHYLRLYRLLKRSGNECPEFLEVARRNARFYMTHQLGGEREGSFGRWWSADGRALDTEGTNGAHMLPVLVELERLTGPSPEIHDAFGRAASYYGGLIERGEYYGDTLDADCVDREAGAILLRAFLDLYEHSGERRHLELAREAACYVLSWMWTYDVTFPAGSPLSRERLRTRGMTAVSVAIQHVDFYGMYIAYDLLRLGNATGEPEWRDCARAMIVSCSQLISTPSNPLNRSGDFIGWQPEHIYQTDFNYFLAELGGKGTYDTCIAWVVVLTLGAMLDIRDRFPEELSFSFDATLLREMHPTLFGSWTTTARPRVKDMPRTDRRAGHPPV